MWLRVIMAASNSSTQADGLNVPVNHFYERKGRFSMNKWLCAYELPDDS